MKPAAALYKTLPRDSQSGNTSGGLGNFRRKRQDRHNGWGDKCRWRYYPSNVYFSSFADHLSFGNNCRCKRSSDVQIFMFFSTGWMTEELFLSYLHHFKDYTQCSTENKCLLILDNHSSHISVQSCKFAKENGIVLLTIPPHTSGKLQPLDKCVYGPFKMK